MTTTKHTHDVVALASIPMNVARDLLARFPDLTSVIAIHEAAEHAGELIDSIEMCGHLERVAHFQTLPTWVCFSCKQDAVEFVPARPGTHAHYACTNCRAAYAAPPTSAPTQGDQQ